MTSSIAPVPAAPSATDAVPDWAGEPALLHGEDARSYEELLAQVRATMGPRDVLEEVWVRDAVDLTWDIFRLRRLKANLLKVDARASVTYAVWPYVRNPQKQAEKLADAWFAGEANAVAQVNDALDAAGYSMDAIMAMTVGSGLKRIERLDAMIANAEIRRGVALAEIERYRASFAGELRGAEQTPA
jgi:hypothetical protein